MSTPAVVQPRLHVRHNQIVATSRDVAQAFRKRHDDVLKKIRALEVPEDWHARNFAEMPIQTKIGNGATRTDPAFEMTRDGFTILTMGFTGKRAMQWKLVYIAEFNRMEDTIRKSGRYEHGSAQQPLPWDRDNPFDFLLKAPLTGKEARS